MQRSDAPHTELSRAKVAIEAMKAATSLDDFEESWKECLRRLERVGNKVQAHYKKSPKFGNWWSPRQKLRTSDPLLAYMTWARGCDEHSVEEIVGRESGLGIRTEPDANGMSVIDEVIIEDYQVVSVKSRQKLHLEFYPAQTYLKPGVFRGREVRIPRTHLGLPVNPSNVIDVAEMGLKFYVGLVEEAEQYFVK